MPVVSGFFNRSLNFCPWESLSSIHSQRHLFFASFSSNFVSEFRNRNFILSDKNTRERGRRKLEKAGSKNRCTGVTNRRGYFEPSLTLGGLAIKNSFIGHFIARFSFSVCGECPYPLSPPPHHTHTENLIGFIRFTKMMVREFKNMAFRKTFTNVRFSSTDLWLQGCRVLIN